MRVGEAPEAVPFLLGGEGAGEDAAHAAVAAGAAEVPFGDGVGLGGVLGVAPVEEGGEFGLDRVGVAAL